MKNLLLVLLLSVVFMSCNQEKSWYEQGHIDPTSECTFIVNDSIQVVGKVYNSELGGDDDILYHVIVNGVELDFIRVGTYHTIFIRDDKFYLETLLKHLQMEYERFIGEDLPLKCFDYER